MARPGRQTCASTRRSSPPAAACSRASTCCAGFILIQPGDEISRQLELLRHLDDADHVARYQEFEDWFKHTQDIPGAFYLWIVRHLFRDNALVARRARGRAAGRSTLGQI